MAQNQVSSPHRYCRNIHGIPFRWLLLGVSSPHRYCRNDDRAWDTGDVHSVSSPHRYCRNTDEAWFPRHARLRCFKPS